MTCPDTVKIARAYGIPSLRIENHREMRAQIRKAIKAAGPVMVDVVLHPMQPFAPRVTSERGPGGKLVSKPLEDMYPFLERNEFNSNMIIKPVKE